MTNTFITNAQQSRVSALTKKKNRDLKSGGGRKANRLPPLTQSQIDDLFASSRETTEKKTRFLAA